MHFPFSVLHLFTVICCTVLQFTCCSVCRWVLSAAQKAGTARTAHDREPLSLNPQWRAVATAADTSALATFTCHRFAPLQAAGARELSLEPSVEVGAGLVAEVLAGMTTGRLSLRPGAVQVGCGSCW